jgi:hypothetical protein
MLREDHVSKINLGLCIYLEAAYSNTRQTNYRANYSIA